MFMLPRPFKNFISNSFRLNVINAMMISKTSFILFY